MARVTERQALEICVLRSIEQSADNGGLWAAADAKEATREARDLIGDRAAFAAMLARRAQWAIQQIGQRYPGQAIRLSDPQWPAVAGWALCALAFVAGGTTDYLTSKQQVDVVEYSLLGLIVWNLVVYASVAVGFALAAWPGRHRAPGLLNASLTKLRLKSALGNRSDSASGSGTTRPWLAACQAMWVQLSQPLTDARIKIAFHTAAIGFAAGVVAVLYWRGLPTEYQAGVPGSTWLDVPLTQRLVDLVMTPGAWLFGLQVPDIQAVAAQRSGGDSVGIARRLFHLHAASLLVWVVLPRLALVLVNALQRWRLRRAFPLPLNAAYFTALRAAWQGQPIGVVVVPFRYELTAPIKAQLQRMLERIYGMAVDIVVQPPVLMGADPQDWKRSVDQKGQVAVFPLFNIVATAEADAHGRLLTQLRAAVAADTPVVPIVDTAAFPLGNDERLRSRQRQWRQMLDEVGAEPLFVDLGRGGEPDLASLQARLDRDD